MKYVTSLDVGSDVFIHQAVGIAYDNNVKIASCCCGKVISKSHIGDDGRYCKMVIMSASGLPYHLVFDSYLLLPLLYYGSYIISAMKLSDGYLKSLNVYQRNYLSYRKVRQ